MSTGPRPLSPLQPASRAPRPTTIPSEQEAYLLTVDEVARRLSVSRRTVYRLLWEKQLFSVRVGVQRRIPLDALQQYLADIREQEVSSGYPARQG